VVSDWAKMLEKVTCFISLLVSSEPKEKDVLSRTSMIVTHGED
jgi:hypothetical protein